MGKENEGGEVTLWTKNKSTVSRTAQPFLLSIKMCYLIADSLNAKVPERKINSQ